MKITRENPAGPSRADVLDDILRRTLWLSAADRAARILAALDAYKEPEVTITAVMSLDEAASIAAALADADAPYTLWEQFHDAVRAVVDDEFRPGDIVTFLGRQYTLVSPAEAEDEGMWNVTVDGRDCQLYVTGKFAEGVRKVR